MFGLFRNKVREALLKDAVVVDVRTVHEYDQGRMPGSINIPLERIRASIDRIRSYQRPVIICSSPDSRGAKAAAILRQNGIKEVVNGGGWEKIFRLSKQLK